MAQPKEIRRLTRHLLESYNDRMAAVAGIRVDTAQELAESRAAHQAMAVAQSQRLAEDRVHLAADTGAFLKEADVAHQAMATAQSQRLAEDRVHLAADTGAFLKEAAVAHQAMAAAQSRYLDAERTQLASDVAAMRAELQARQDELRATQHEARRIWTSFATIMRARRAIKPAPATPSPPPIQPAQETPAAVEMVADDLAAIRGIGPSMQKKLNDAGILNFAQLGASTPEALRKVLGDAVGRLAKVEEWIAQAQELG
ncbi:MAG: hypothetical protein ISS56_15295 [Anaerolineae bacterium]|nr:hypothetical protein [Anaerolineae bacterium]